MRISIITPSYNHAKFIEQTITSVLDQKYGDLEYIVMDGGSEDGSVEIIRKYEKHLTFWQSQKDGGQANAINMGIRRATGDIIAYINSDDYYLPNAFERAVESFEASGAQWIASVVDHVDIAGHHVAYQGPVYYTRLAETLAYGVPIGQPGVFWRAELFRKFGLFDESFHYVLDTEFLIRLLADEIWPNLCPDLLACRKMHGETKTEVFPGRFMVEMDRVREAYVVTHRRISRESLDAALLRKSIWASVGRARAGLSRGDLTSFCRDLANGIGKSPLHFLDELRRRSLSRLYRSWSR